MSLLFLFSSQRRGRFLMRLGCCLVCFSLIVCLMLPQQRVYAVEPLTMTAVASLAAAYLGSCGLSLVVSGMDSNGLVSNIQRLIQEFLDTELGGISIQDWLVGVWDLSVIAGKIFMGRPLTNEFASFAQWVAANYGTQEGVNVVYSDRTITFADGSTYALSFYHDIDEAHEGGGYYSSYHYSLGTDIQFGSKSDPLVIQMTSSWSVSFYFDGYLRYCRFDDGSILDQYDRGVHSVTFLIGDSGNLRLAGVYPEGDLRVNDAWGHPILSVEDVSSLLNGSSFSLDRVLSQLYIPEGIEAEQGIALDVGAAATMDHDQVLQSVLDKILTGTLSPTMEVAGEAVVNPPAEEIADVDGLGLPALGAALTSRFPFSIPWDFFRAVQLLAAPAKAPYFEVDFMEPLADDVGGWQGSTKVVLDFEQYAIIGQISRWTSTIGFCLMLAGSTKRLIWTA